MSDISDEEIQGEIDRAVREVRAALSALARRESLPAQLMGLCTLLDRVECTITTEDGDSAFVLAEAGDAVAFRTSVVRNIATTIAALSKELELDAIGGIRTKQISINLFVIHEIIHIRQNFPDFATVKKIKAGLPGLGLPLLDLAADLLSAWVCAHVEAAHAGERGRAVLKHYVNCLMLSYVLGSMVYDSREKDEKRQRMIGVVMSAVLAQAMHDGMLRKEAISEGWHLLTPIFPLHLPQSQTFNGLVTGQLPGLLLSDRDHRPSPELMQIWEHVGRPPTTGIFKLVAKAFARAGAIILPK